MALPTYAEKEVIKAQLRPSPSALYSNLACVEGNLVYAHNRSACILAPDSVTQNVAVAVRRGDSESKDTIYSVTACHMNGGPAYIVLGTEGGLQVWDKTLYTLVHVWTVPEADRVASTSTIATFVRGAAMVQAADGSTNLCFGCSTGSVYVMRVDKDGSFGSPASFSNHTAPITCIGSDFQSRRADGRRASSGPSFVTCDQEGVVTVWSASSPTDVKLLSTIASSSVPATCVAVRGDTLVLGRLDGVVQLYSLASGKLKVEVTAHARFLIGLDVHPTKDLVATVSEDATINVWAMPLGSEGSKVTKVQSLLSANWMYAMPTGVVFCGPESATVAAVALDTEEIRVFKPAL